jgi:isoleucyl-tRNA synthetase
MAQEGDLWLLLDLNLTKELQLEGMMRDFLRNLQLLRKELGFQIEDRIQLKYFSDSRDAMEIFIKWKEFLQSELLAISIEIDTRFKNMAHENATDDLIRELSVNECKVFIMMKKM